VKVCYRQYYVPSLFVDVKQAFTFLSNRLHMRFVSSGALAAKAVVVAACAAALAPHAVLAQSSPVTTSVTTAESKQIGTTSIATQPTILRRETISGVARSSAGAPLANIVVIATMAPERRTFSDTTDAAGRYSLNIGARHRRLSAVRCSARSHRVPQTHRARGHGFCLRC
jgi:hypothetical protein